MSKLKSFYFFLVVLYSGMALTFFRSDVGLIVLWLIGMWVFQKETIYPSRKLFAALGVWLSYFIINTIIIGSFHPLFMGTYIAKIMIAYWLLSYYKEKIFFKYENVIYTLTVISLIFYTIQLIAPTPMFSLFKSIDLSQNLFPHRAYASIGIYTYHDVGLYEKFPRNSGFCWEPGPFSSYVVLALFVNLARNSLKFTDINRIIIFLIAIISGQSTTSLVVLLAIFIWLAWSRYKNKAFRVLSIPIAVVVVVLLFVNVPWLQDKIIIESEQNINEIISHANKSGESYAPGRFASFQLRWEDFKNYPIAGFGGNTKLQAGYLGEDNVVAAINGVGTILGKYGAIGFVLFVWLVFKTGKWLSLYYKYSADIIFPIIIAIIGFGFSIIESPIIVTMWMIPVFLLNKNNYFPFRRNYKGIKHENSIFY